MTRIHFHGPRVRRSTARTLLISQGAPIESKPSPRFWIYLVAGLIVLLALVEFARAGGPQFVAGVGYFDANVAGHPITWANGTIRYYTDQGNLSAVLPGASADAFVADAFSRWTSISTAGASATRAGQLAEDVSGANVILNSDHTITLPFDIQPTATATPLGIVYDADGAVTDALMGSGASQNCFDNSSFGGADAFTTDGHFAHALLVLNGKCVPTSSDLPDFKYRLVRALGRVLGLGWSQLNLNAVSGSPPPTADDLAGLPVMHEQDLFTCVPISICYPNADVPKMDDRAALSRLYPVTTDNASNFPGKQIFATATARIRGSVRFTDENGNPAQPMQGVNVVARWIDQSSGKPSGSYAAASVSGFLFAGNAGNAITGYTDALGNPYNRFGSSDASLEGFFDLAGLEIPSGNTAQYQLSVEPVDGDLSQNVGPYAPWQVLPSGTAQLILLSVSKGADLLQDVLMISSAGGLPETGEPDSFVAPRRLPVTGEWMGTISGYGDHDYFALNGQANRTLTMQVTALDEDGHPTVQKAQPVIGMWDLADPEGTPPPSYTFSSFNVVPFAMTQLNSQLLSSTAFRIGIADMRGDGRPDFRYHARVLYGDSVTPNRISVRGGPIALTGVGFQPGMILTMSNTQLTQLAVYPSELIATMPAFQDGVQTLTITDPATGASSVLSNAITLGAGPNDTIRLPQGTNAATPVGGEAATPVRVTVASSDGLTAISGATILWNATNRAGLSACNGASTCLVVTDESGQTETRVTIGAVGATTITATLAPASYSPPKAVQVSINGTSSAKDLVLSSPKVWVLQGATLDIPLTARVLASGVPQSGQTLNWQIGIGSGTFTRSIVSTDGDGYGRTSLHVNALAADVQGTVCVGPGNSPCQTFYVMQVAGSAIRLQPVFGSLQTIRVGETFLPITVRVTNSATPPNPVMGVPVTFQSMIFLPDEDSPVETGGGDGGSSHHAMKVLLGSSVNTTTADANGLASLLPSAGSLGRPLEIEITASAGSGKLEFELPVLPAAVVNPGASTGRARVPRPGSAKARTVSPTIFTTETQSHRVNPPAWMGAVREMTSFEWGLGVETASDSTALDRGEMADVAPSGSDNVESTSPKATVECEEISATSSDEECQAASGVR